MNRTCKPLIINTSTFSRFRGALREKIREVLTSILRCDRKPWSQRCTHWLFGLGASRNLPAGSFVPRIIRVVVRGIVIARIACRTRSDSLLQFFNFELNQFFHLVSPPNFVLSF